MRIHILAAIREVQQQQSYYVRLLFCFLGVRTRRVVKVRRAGLFLLKVPVYTLLCATGETKVDVEHSLCPNYGQFGQVVSRGNHESRYQKAEENR
jgi:hypothetical protein